MNKNFSITLGELKSHVLLSQVLKKVDPDYTKRDELKPNLTVPAGKEVLLIDDLGTGDFNKVFVTIVIDTKAAVDYKLRVIDTPRTYLAGKPIVSSVRGKRKLQEHLIHFVLAGHGARLCMKGSYLCGKKRAFKLTTVQQHKVSHTKSSVDIKGVFEGQSQFTCDNLIRVEPATHCVDVYQMNKNLLLSDQARVVSIPKMEVQSHKVHCKHGTATSRLNDDQLFYLQSRGLSMVQAYETLIQAFIG
jgi:hypothetical protein